MNLCQSGFQKKTHGMPGPGNPGRTALFRASAKSSPRPACKAAPPVLKLPDHRRRCHAKYLMPLGKGPAKVYNRKLKFPDRRALAFCPSGKGIFTRN